ncbi:uncharacterized protein LOC62_04G006589 [Vanrija pseudolonga]|uniref:F-box domain-containing protein n=1 Tax=Vanrija pseudolonga TaxID=143232 RepID=A0AAF0YGJ5_9TREE|nr:hypothetical protein LOC62_04G006589 [Vanrija pseudolonga]
MQRNEPHRQEQSPFASLPAEVMTIIARWVLTDDILAMRETCKSVEIKLASSFSYEFFRKRQFFISTPSLEALVGISKHPRLHSVLTHVIIATDRFEQLSLHRVDPVQYDNAKKYVAAADDQDYLYKSGKYRDYLFEAFSNLTNLDAVELRDFNSRTRYRDGALAFWCSYGSPTFQRLKNKIFPPPAPHPAANDKNGFSLSMLPDGNNYFSPHKIFAGALVQNILIALAESGSRPTTFEINLRDIHWSIQDSTFFIPRNVRPKLLPVLDNLRSLLLAVTLVDTDLQPVGFRAPHLKEFIKLCPNIDHLRLNFGFSPGSADVLVWLADNDGASALVTASPSPTVSPAGSPNTNTNGADAVDGDPMTALTLPSPSPPALANLRSLDLGFVDTDIPTFEAILMRFPDLENLGLFRVCLHDEADTTVVIKDGLRQGTNIWVNLFEDLADKPTNITRLSVGMVTQTTAGVPGRNWVGHSRYSDPNDLLSSKVYFTNKFRKTSNVWATAAQCMKVKWPQYVIPTSSHGSDTDGDDDEDDEDDEDEAEDENAGDDDDNEDDNNGDNDPPNDDE